MAAKKVVATTSFVCDEGGSDRFVHPGEPFATNDPIVKKHRELFAPEPEPTKVGEVR